MVGFSPFPFVAVFYGLALVFLIVGRIGAIKGAGKWWRWLSLAPITLFSIFFLVCLLGALVALVTSKMEPMAVWLVCIFTVLPLFVIYNVVFIHIKQMSGRSDA